MIRALGTAATGMEAQQAAIDILSHNLANVNTAGFSRARGDFEDLLYETIRSPGAAAAQGRQIPVGIQIGHGSRLVSTQVVFTPGQVRETGNTLDLAIEGTGFFQVSLPDGRTGYTRAGTFKTDSSGRMTTADGNLLDPAITIPADATKITIGSDGTVSVKVAGQSTTSQLGQIQLASFANPAGLERTGHNIYLETGASGQPRTGKPGDSDLGTLAQGSLEMSNVQVVEEMIELIVAQRAYEANSKVIKAADDMLQATANLK
jgi:flagellar basal-body rod protein FlgG